MEEHTTQPFFFLFLFSPLARAHLLKTLHLFSSPVQETQFQYRRAKQISHMDMYANLGDDEAILWGLNRACDDVN